MSTVIFDFDGTIADTLPAGVEIYNAVARAKGYAEITDQNRDRLREMTAREVIKELHIPFVHMLFVGGKIRTALNARMASLRPFPGIEAVVRTLNERSITLMLLSSNSEKNIRKFLAGNSLDCFDRLHCGIELFGKEAAIRHALTLGGIERSEAFYVGDEIRDVEAAKRAGVRAIAVTWGVNTKASLMAMKPDFIAEAPEDLLKIVRT